MPIIDMKYTGTWPKTAFLVFSRFHCERLIEVLKKNFDKSQIVCPGKKSEIPQITFCLDRNAEIPKMSNLYTESSQPPP